MRARLLVKNRTALVKSLRSEVESRVRGAAKRLPAAITSPVQLLIRTSREFADDDCATHAAAIAFHTLFGLFPLLLGTGVILSFFSAGREAYADALQNLSELFPEVEYLVEQNVRGSVDLRGVFGIVALGTLLWSGSRIFQALRLALNAAWDVTSRRQALKAKAVDFAAVLAYRSADAAVRRVYSLDRSRPLCRRNSRRHRSVSGVPERGGYLAGCTPPHSPGHKRASFRDCPTSCFPICASAGLTPCLVLCSRRSSSRWESWGFAWYVSNLASFSLVYGSLSTVIVLMVWIYISAIILLIGAEFSSEFSRRRLGARNPDTVAGAAG